MNHVVIIGFMGSGKTRVGKQLSRDLGLPFVDLEKLIVKKMNLSVREIFEKFGEPFFRALETMALKELINDSERRVISLGSGLPLQEQNQKYLKELGTVVYLKGSLETLKKDWKAPAKIRFWMEKTGMIRSKSFLSSEILFIRSLRTFRW